MICHHVNIKNFIYRFRDNVYNLYSLWLNLKFIIVVSLFNQDFYLKKPWNIFRNELLICKLLAVHVWEKLFINSKLFTLQKNLKRVHLWGTFASHWRRVARVGYCGLSIKMNAGIWLVSNTDTPWQWGVHWMETQFLAIFLLFKKGTATSIFNNSPALYRNICCTCVQILGDLSMWTPKLSFSEVRKHIVKFES